MNGTSFGFEKLKHIRDFYILYSYEALWIAWMKMNEIRPNSYEGHPAFRRNTKTMLPSEMNQKPVTEIWWKKLYTIIRIWCHAQWVCYNKMYTQQQQQQQKKNPRTRISSPTKYDAADDWMK